MICLWNKEDRNFMMVNTLILHCDFYFVKEGNIFKNQIFKRISLFYHRLARRGAISMVWDLLSSFFIPQQNDMPSCSVWKQKSLDLIYRAASSSLPCLAQYWGVCPNWCCLEPGEYVNLFLEFSVRTATSSYLGFRINNVDYIDLLLPFLCIVFIFLDPHWRT